MRKKCGTGFCEEHSFEGAHKPEVGWTHFKVKEIDKTKNEIKYIKGTK